MSTSYIFMIATIVISLSPLKLVAEGSQVVVLLENGERLTGELLAVRDTAVVLSDIAGTSDEDLAFGAAAIEVIRNDDIQSITVRGSSYVLPAMGIGLVGGFAVGWAIGSSSKSENVAEEVVKPVTSAVSAGLGSLIGIGVGAIVGVAASPKDLVITVFTPDTLRLLREKARYGGHEPSFMQHNH
jgi:hypothetical protein